MSERKFIKVEFSSSWLEAVQMANAAVMLGLGVQVSNEKVHGDAEYRLDIYTEPFPKPKSEVIIPEYKPGQASDDLDWNELATPGTKGYL